MWLGINWYLVFLMFIGFTLGEIYHALCQHFWPKVDGTMTIREDDEKIKWELHYNGDPYEINKKRTVTFKIKVEE